VSGERRKGKEGEWWHLKTKEPNPLSPGWPSPRILKEESSATITS
jgi:hypothetical protein